VFALLLQAGSFERLPGQVAHKQQEQPGLRFRARIIEFPFQFDLIVSLKEYSRKYPSAILKYPNLTISHSYNEYLKSPHPKSSVTIAMLVAFPE
jgi:hypothetical protein